ncbi:hypothetical protein P3S68_021803 [Capsicum galapagoense]
MDTTVTLQFTYKGCFLSDPILRVNKKDCYYMLNSDADVLRFTNRLKAGDFVEVYVVHQISEPLLVDDENEVEIAKKLASKIRKSSVSRADVYSPLPFDGNENEYTNENHSHRVDKGKFEVSLEELKEGQVNDFSTYHLQTSDSEVDLHINDSDGDLLYDVDENIDDVSDLEEELLQDRKSNIEK